MFWITFSKLCMENGQSANSVAKEIGISSGSITAWKKGIIPRPEMVKKIADYFNVSVEYLMTGEKEKPDATIGDGLTEQELEIIQIFRQLPDQSKGLLLSVASEIAKSFSPPAK